MIKDVIWGKTVNFLLFVIILACISILENAKVAGLAEDHNKVPVQIPDKDESAVQMPLAATLSDNSLLKFFEYHGRKIKVYWRANSPIVEHIFFKPHFRYPMKRLRPNKLEPKFVNTGA